MKIKVNAEIMEITPTIAKIWLEKNANNRPLRQGVVNAYAEDMLHNRWEVNAQPIVFGRAGELLDGQHRLNAIVKANVPVYMMVVNDAPSSKLYDVGLRRSTPDILRFKDNNNTGFMYSAYGISVIRNIIGNFSGGNGRHGGITTNQIEEYINENKEYLEDFFNNIIENTSSSIQRGLRTSAVPAALYFAYRAGVDKDKIKRFYKVFLTGLSTDTNEVAIILVRNKFLKDSKAMTDTERAKRIMWSLDKYVNEVVVSISCCPSTFIYSITGEV